MLYVRFVFSERRGGTVTDERFALQLPCTVQYMRNDFHFSSVLDPDRYGAVGVPLERSPSSHLLVANRST